MVQGRWLKEENGFTMIELIIVIAIMGILSSVLVPSFSNITIKTRLKADIATIQQVQTQIEIYMAEKDGEYPGKLAAEDSKTLPGGAVKALVDGDYIKKSDTENQAAIKLQTKGAEIVYKGEESHLALDVSKADEKVKETARKLSDNELKWLP